MSDTVSLPGKFDSCDPSSPEQLLPLVYDELRRLASQLMVQEKPGQTIQPTALVHEAYVRLTEKSGTETRWDNRGHFFSAAAEAMRRLLVEKARRKNRLKHGGEWRRIGLESTESLFQLPCEDLLAIDESLSRLIAADPLKAEVVKLRFFAGLTMPEVAKSLNISLATAERYWTFARTWLFADLTDDEPK